MKSLISITVLSLTTIVLSAQGRYYTLQECGRDSLKYIERNYEDNMSRYIGKTVAFLVDECELLLDDFIPYIYTAFEGVNQEIHNKVVGIYFDFYQDDYRYSVLLLFDPPYPYNRTDYYQVENSDYTEKWKPVYYNFFKDYKINDIGVLKRKDGKTLKNYRRP